MNECQCVYNTPFLLSIFKLVKKTKKNEQKKTKKIIFF